MKRVLFFLVALTLSQLVSVNQLAFAEPAATTNFMLKDMSGNKHQLSSYKGKWVLVKYWATWCRPCLEEVPELVNLYDQRKQKDLMVIGVVFDYKDVKEVNEYVDDMLMSYPIVLGDDSVTTQIGSAEVMPTTYIYNPQGALVKIKRGLITREYIERMIDGKK
jgi:thiol-disulfide isomerase/thioredoxin